MYTTLRSDSSLLAGPTCQDPSVQFASGVGQAFQPDSDEGSNFPAGHPANMLAIDRSLHVLAGFPDETLAGTPLSGWKA